MATEFDLNAYLERIHWGGKTEPVFETLSGLLLAHMSRIPFENLDVLLRRPVRLDIGAVQDKLVRAHRGGYCFEHGALFAAALEALGFKPVRHTARVVLIMPLEASPRAHMLLTVPLADGTFIVDPGFGGPGPRVPVPLVEGEHAGCGGEDHSMRRDGHHWFLQSHAGGKTANLWASTLEPDNLIDFEVGNHFTATHPNSPFVNRLMLRAFHDDTRVSVMNRDVTVSRGNESRSIKLNERGELRRLLVDHFGFDLPEVDRIVVPVIPEWN